jgi:CHAD domain-containing protein
MVARVKDKFPLLDYLDELVEQLSALSARAIKDRDIDAVHDARVATRRLKAAVELVEDVVARRPRERFEKITKSLRKNLGPLRDRDVMLDHLAHMHSVRIGPAVEWMRQRLEKSRKKAADEAAIDLRPPRIRRELRTWWPLRHEIETVKDSVGSLLAQSIHLRLDAFSAQADRLAQPDHPEHDPHTLRITSKSLRYTLELAKANGSRLPKSVFKHFKRIQDALGLWHDYVILADRVLKESHKQSLAQSDADLQQALLSLASGSLRRAQKQMSMMIDWWQLDGAEMVRQIREIFPLTEPAESPVVSMVEVPVASDVEAPVMSAVEPPAPEQAPAPSTVEPREDTVHESAPIGTNELIATDEQAKLES